MHRIFGGWGCFLGKKRLIVSKMEVYIWSEYDFVFVLPCLCFFPGRGKNVFLMDDTPPLSLSLSLSLSLFPSLHLSPSLFLSFKHDDSKKKKLTSSEK